MANYLFPCHLPQGDFTGKLASAVSKQQSPFRGFPVLLRRERISCADPGRWVASNRINAGTSYLAFLFPFHFPGKPEMSENKNAPQKRSIDSSFAERAGFEPAVQLPVRQFSKLFLSATQASLRTGRKGKWLRLISKVKFSLKENN